jgi:hypothetical protein
VRKSFKSTLSLLVTSVELNHDVLLVLGING